MDQRKQQGRGSPPPGRKGPPPQGAAENTKKIPPGSRKPPPQGAREVPKAKPQEKRPSPVSGRQPKPVHKQEPASSYQGGRRRQGKKQNPRRRKLKMWLLYTLMVLAVLGVGAALSLTVLFKIETIDVVGETRYPADQIIAYSGIEKGQNLFLCESKDGKTAIETNLPYIEGVQIRRQIPSKITIEVTEAVAAGMVEYGGGYVAISRQGKVLEIAAQSIEGLPILYGLELSSAEPAAHVTYREEGTEQALQDITNAIAACGLDKITEIDMTKRTSPRLLYDGRIRIMIGKPLDLDLKLRFAMEIMSKLAPDDRGILDVSIAKENSRGYFLPDATVSASSQGPAAGDSSEASSQEASSIPQEGEGDVPSSSEAPAENETG